MRQVQARSALYFGLGASAVIFVLALTSELQNQFAWDFSINWTAANALQRHASLYSHDALRSLSQSLIGPGMASMFRDSFTSYIGPPTTALLLLPYTLFSFPIALVLYRVSAAFGFMASVVCCASSLSSRSKRPGLILGVLSLLLFNPVVVSLGLGQVDAWVMLCLSIGILASSRAMWGIAGLGFGIAALLKVSPVLILLYLLMRGKLKSIYAAAGGGISALILVALIGNPSDVVLFFREVSPSLSSGSIHIQNQSLPAWLARMMLPDNNLTNFAHGTGVFNLLVLVSAFGMIVWLAWSKREHRFTTAEYAPLILLALLVGPISWDHYLSWGILPLILLADARLWGDAAMLPRRTVWLLTLGAGALLMMLPTLYFTPEAISANWLLRVGTGMKTLALLLWLVVCTSLLLCQHNPAAQPPTAGNRAHPPHEKFDSFL